MNGERASIVLRTNIITTTTMRAVTTTFIVTTTPTVPIVVNLRADSPAVDDNGVVRVLQIQ